jgi:leucyl-tRNA---protein transferase
MMADMESQFRFVAPPGPCSYLPDRTAQFENEVVADATPEDYFERMRQGWRRFGHVFFRPVCLACRACRSLRVDVGRFRPSRPQRRNRKLNDGAVQLRIGQPSVSPGRLDL